MGFGIRTYLNRHFLRIIDDLPLYAPGSAGDAPMLAALTLQSAQQVFPLLVQIALETGSSPIQTISSSDFGVGADSEARQLGQLFERYGSDKVSHNYHPVYAKILKARDARQIIEVGLGTNNEAVPSNMTSAGKPGASLRAFRDFLPNSVVLGADIDHGALFTEDRIDTVWVDQTDTTSFSELMDRASGYSLLIDDGLHSPNANLAVLLFGLRTMKVGAWTVIEDIVPAASPLWQIVGALLPRDCYDTILIQARTSMMFAVNRVS